jgi:hypothetical protein
MQEAVAVTPEPVKPEFYALARETGLEPATSGVTGRRSNQLSYSRFGGGEALGRETVCVKRATARLRHVKNRFLVGGDGFEPPTLSV